VKRLLESENGAQDSKVLGGTGRISLELAKTLPDNWIRRNSPVRSIDTSKSVSDGVITVRGDDFTVRAKTVILAIPPVQQLRIQWTPALEPNRMQALQHFPMGHIIKTFCFYERKFWGQQGFNGSAVADSGISVVTLDDSKPGSSEGIIMGFVVSDQAREWASKTPEQRRDALAQHYAKVFGTDEALKVIRYKDKCWADEQFVGGCYVGVPTPGTLIKFPMKDYVGHPEPIPRVFVAGTEAARVFVGYLDGAVEAGERAGRNSLVRLGTIPASDYELVSSPAPSPQMPFVPMEISWAEKYLLPSVPQALFGALLVVGAAATGLAVKKWGWPRALTFSK
jgi:monoamine oxidase